MNILDRTKIPASSDIEFKGFPEYLKGKLSNGIQWYGFHHDDFSVLRMEIIIPGGSWIQNKILQAALTSKMLFEGSKSYNSYQLASEIDFMGAFTASNSDYHNTNISLYVLKSKFKELLKLIKLVIAEASFPEKELTVMMMNLKQEYIVNSQKVSTLAKRKFPSLLYGAEHPYGRVVTESDFEQIKRQDLLDFYSRLNPAKMRIYLGGGIDEQTIDDMEEVFGQESFSHNLIQEDDFIERSMSEKTHFVEKSDAIQTAIMIGKKVINKDNVDFPLLSLVNTILGGYFGSRLMSKIREEKGLTYGIFTYLSTNPKSAAFVIQTEVKAEVAKEALHEIFSEISRLSKERMEQEELNLVRNFMMGSIMRSFDGPFQLVDRLSMTHAFGLDTAKYYNHVIESLKNANLDDVSRIMKEQLNANQMYVLTAGSK